jgi:DNA-binding transcriptional LysR family regulator
MNIMRIRYFVETAACGSFSEAARRVYTSQSNISKQIAQLEEELGYPLFIREHRKVHLTEAGQYLYEQWEKLPEQIATQVEHGRKLSENVNRISIGILEGQDVNEMLLDKLEQLHQINEGYTFSLERNSYKNLRNGLRNGSYDIIITLDFDVMEEWDFEYKVMYQKSPAIAMRKSHPLAKRADFSLADLKNENFVVISKEESPGGYNRLLNSCADCGFKPHIVREPNSLETLLLCVEMGMGIALLDQNTRLELSPYVVTIPQKAKEMAVVAAIQSKEERHIIRRVAEFLAKDE